METGSISRWNVKEGDRFEPGTSLCDVETDKATVSFDATEEGFLAKILVGTGEVKVGQPIMVTVEEAGDVAAFATFSLSSTTNQTSSAPTPTSPATTPAATVSNTPAQPVVANVSAALVGGSGRIFASPLAKKIAREAQASIDSIFDVLGGKGSGANNRVVSADVTKGLSLLASQPKSAATSAPAPTVSAPTPVATHAVATTATTTTGAPFADFELAESARQLAHRLTHNKQTVPHYYVSVEINLAQLLKIREQFNQQFAANKKTSGEGLSVFDFLVKAAALAVKQVPDVNASWMETFVRRYDQVDVNVVMGSGSTLSTPVLRKVNDRGLLSISEEIRQHESSLFSADQSIVNGFLQDETKQAVGTFTIHNLGSYGVKSAAPIVMPPQACALAIGAIQETIVPRKAGEEENGKAWEVAPVVVATVSCDHRVVDGAVSAQYLAAFKQLVENPLNLLL